jgi:hypothetical protein
VIVAQQPAPAGKVAGIAAPPAPAPPTNARVRRSPAFFRNLTVAVLPDGRVFADFGRGFEQVVNWCGVPATFDAQSSSLIQPTVVQPTVIQPSAGVNQPLPQMLPQESKQAQQQAQAVRSTLVNTQMCWSNDPRGRVFVGHP